MGHDLGKNRINEMKGMIAKEIEEAFQYAKKSPFPKIEMLNEHIYKN